MPKSTVKQSKAQVLQELEAPEELNLNGASVLTPEAFAQLQEGRDTSYRNADGGELLEAPVVAFGKPGRNSFFCLCDQAGYDLVAPFTTPPQTTRDATPYLLLNNTHRQLTPGQVSIRRVVLGFRETGECFIWSPAWYDAGEEPSNYHRSVARVIHHARQKWVRIEWDMGASQYAVYGWSEAQGESPAVVWPVEDFREILERSLEGRIITGPNHPQLARRGEVLS